MKIDITIESEGESQVVGPWLCRVACRQPGRVATLMEAGWCVQTARCKGQSPADQEGRAADKRKTHVQDIHGHRLPTISITTHTSFSYWLNLHISIGIT